MSKSKQARFAQIEEKTFLPKRRVEVLVGAYEEFTIVINNRHWQKLTTLEPNYNEFIVGEFYANV